MDKEEATMRLFKAIETNNLADARATLDEGADVNAGRDTLNPRQTRDTPLHYAAYDNNAQLTKLLIERGADINAENSTHTTPLSLAKHRGHTEIAELLETAAAKQRGHAGRVADERKDKGPPQVGG